MRYMSKEAEDIIHTMITKQYTNIKGIQIVLHDEVIFESYYGISSDIKIHVASVTKSVLSLLIGIAIDKGYLESVDQKVMDFFPKYTFSDTNRLRNQITIKQLLTMTCPFPFPSMKESFSRMCRQKDWMHYCLEIMGQGKPSGFKYSTASAHILSGILTKCTNMSTREFANLYLFEPLGIDEVQDHTQIFDVEHLFGDKVEGWVKDPLDYTAGGWGLCMSLNDLSSIARLCMHKGIWDGKRIVSETWLQESLLPHTKKYGYMWWLDTKRDSYMAAGAGGSIIYINPSKGMSISILSSMMKNPKDRTTLIDYLLEQI